MSALDDATSGASDSTAAFTAILDNLTASARGARFEVGQLGSSLQSVAASRTALDGAVGV